MTPEDKLRVLLSATRPPVRDFAFEAEAARRLALSRAWARVAALFAIVLTCGALLWLTAPAIEQGLREAGPDLRLWAMSLTLAVAAAFAGVRLSARFGPLA